MDASLDTPQTYNRHWVLDQIGGDEDLLEQIIDVFMLDSPSIRQQLHEALQAGDCKALHAAAHCAKSSVGNFGAGSAVMAAQALEHAALNKEESRLAELTAALCQALLRVEASLRPSGNAC